MILRVLFWSSVELTGNQTQLSTKRETRQFWSSVELTGNQTYVSVWAQFWSSVELTGNQTGRCYSRAPGWFWSSVELTGNQTLCFWNHGVVQFWSSVELTGNQTATGQGPPRRGPCSPSLPPLRLRLPDPVQVRRLPLRLLVPGLALAFCPPSCAVQRVSLPHAGRF